MRKTEALSAFQIKAHALLASIFTHKNGAGAVKVELGIAIPGTGRAARDGESDFPIQIS